MDRRRPIKMVCSTDLHVRQEEIQKDRIYNFLAALDQIFDSIRNDLLRMKPIPGIKECFNMVQREAQRQVTMLGKRELGEGSHMAMISKTSISKTTLRAIEDAEKDKLRCSHCNGTRHTKDTYFEIHGKIEKGLFISTA
ncbi:conserved hypothetical protein [Ricinus communis]|uniref:Uncharacterized protein n=1 Tax=Ricinus communis TaxID=3988 RepID=B9RBP0_RICCO|nr:conserved hypothetical protein [Ricinus communis]